MLTIPEKYTEDIQLIIAWHLSAYIPDKMVDIPTKRILERLKNGTAILEDKELYYINDCVADAKNNASECGVEQVILDEIFDWIHPKYTNTKRQQT